MSRCFPYPPPGYSRNGATYEALIESIKLQKENDKAKAERKKEKKAKKERKEKHKEKRKDEEKAKKLPIQPSVNFKEAHIKKTNPTIEQLERSDLTEEHGQPIGSSHKPSYSSDSTQNSNKRKREDVVVPPPDSSSVPVKPFKIRLLKKQKDLDSIKETSCSNSGRTDSPTLSVLNARLNPREVSTSGAPASKSVNGKTVPLTSLVSSNRKTVALSQIKSTPSVVDKAGTKTNDLKGSTSGRKQSNGQISGRPICPSVPPVPSLPKKIDVGPSYGRRPEMPIIPLAPSVSRKNEVQGGKRSINEITVAGNNVAPARIEKEKEVGPTQVDKKMKKKVSKYEKLIGSWVPPVVEVLEGPGGGGDDDWLMGSGKVKTARSSSSSASRDELEKNRESSSMSLWQPCARYLVEADIHALPYTVPF